MPPLFRIDVGQQVYYALDEDEKKATLGRIQKDNPRAKPTITRFKGLGEMNPLQLRETVMDPNTRRLVQLEIKTGDNTHRVMDMLLAKKRAADRKDWLEKNGNKAEIV
jgi:topoisomerase-4 subunit B